MLWRTISKYSSENLELKNKLQKRATSPSASVQDIVLGSQHCFDEKHCGNKWRVVPDLDYYKSSRKKRDLSNPLLERKRPRFGSNARTTTQRPNENKQQSSRFSHRSLPSSNSGSIRQGDSRAARGGQDRTKSAPHSFTPSQRKYQRTGKTEQATERVERKSLASTSANKPKFGRNRQAPTPTSATSKPRFGRGRALTPVTTTTTTTRPRFSRGRVASSFLSTTSRPVIGRNRARSSSLTTTTSRPKFDRSKIFKLTTTSNRETNSSTKVGESKLPLTFRQHHILAQSKTEKPTMDDEVEDKVAVTEATNTTETSAEIKPVGKEKEDEASINKNDDEDEYVDEDEDESDENYVEGDDELDDKVDSKAKVSDETNKTPALKISEDSSGERGIKILNIFPVTSQGTVFKAEIGGKEYRFNGKDWIKVEDDDDKSSMEDDDESYSDEYYEEDDDTDSNKNSQNESNNVGGGDGKGNLRDPKSSNASQNESQKSADAKSVNGSSKEADDDAYEDDSYEDEWDSEEIDNLDLDQERVPEGESNGLTDKKYFVGRGVTNGDMTELSPTGTTLNVKQDNEFELGETEGDDFEETNRAVRKTSLGRRKDQTLGGGEKFVVENGKDSSSKATLGSINGGDNEKSVSNGMSVRYFPEDDVYDDPERIDEEDFYEEELQDSLPGLSSQKGLSKPAGESRISYDDDEYVDEYEETSTNKKSGILNAKLETGGLNRGSLLHLPIPMFKNVQHGVKGNGRTSKKPWNEEGSRESWDDSEENYTQEQDEEYSNEKFLDEDEQYDDQEEGHDHTPGGKDSEDELYPDEEEEMNRSSRVKYTPLQRDRAMTQEDPEYSDDEKTDSRAQSNQSRKKETKLTPLPYLRFVNPDTEEEITTPLPSTPNLFRTVKPRVRTWKQASAPELPPVILHRRTTTAAPVVQTTQTSRGLRKGKFGSPGRVLGRQGSAIDEREQQVTQSPRRWTPRQQVTQSDSINDTKGFLPTRRRYNARAHAEQDQVRTSKVSSPKSPRFYLPKPTLPTPSTKVTSPPTAPNRYGTSKPRPRTNVRKRITDIVQFSESQVSKSRQNFLVPYPENERESDYSFQSNAEQRRYDSSKSRNIDELRSNDENDYLIPPSILPSLVDNPLIAVTPSLVTNNTYFPLPMPSSTQATPEAFSCNGLQLYVYHADPSNPRLFHYCSHGFSRSQILDFRFSCVKGMSFSEEAQSCL